MSTEYWLEKLNLIPHPEGGYYKETYRSKDSVEFANIGYRNISTAIYFLIDGKNKSHLHKIKSDEMWFYHDGNPLEIFVFSQDGYYSILLGKDPEKGEVLQAVVPAGCWFGAKLKNGVGYSLVSCTVAPGFDFNDFELACSADLIKQFPENSELIKEMCIKQK